MGEAERPTTAYTLSLVGGILILLGGLMTTLVGMWGFGLMGAMRGMMSSVQNIVGAMVPMVFQMVVLSGAVGTISGVAVIIAAIQLKNKPEQHSTWSTIIIVFSAISLVGAQGGFLVGMVLGIVGGALGLSWRPSE